QRVLARMPQTARVRKLEDFIHDARLALANTGDALKATANPIEPVYASARGRTWVLSANVQAYALALTITFLTLMLAAGSLAALAREARSASLVALLVVLPIVFLGLIPSEIVPPAGWASSALPFTHAFQLFRSALFDLSPWGEVIRQAVWLLVLGGIFGALARLGARRLLA